MNAEPVDADSTSLDARQAVDLARAHGIVLDPESIRFNEAGLDFQVAFADAVDGTEWVLRIPRRTDVADGIGAESRILGLVRQKISAAVPDWRVEARDLIAYPKLPGEPGLTLDDDGAPVWHFDRESEHHARSLGRLIAELHVIDLAEAQGAGIPTESPDQVRAAWRSRLDRVAAEFAITPSLHEQWRGWLGDDALWPEYTVFTHGELYPMHLLLDADGGIRSVLDWTTAKVSDPALDFMYHAMMSSPAALRTTLDAYAAATGRVPPNLEARCAALVAAGPLTYADYALTTGSEDHAAEARRLLQP